MKRRHSLALMGLLLSGGALGVPAMADYRSDAISVEVIDRKGQPFEVFPLRSAPSDNYRAYLKAERGASYRIRVRNRSGERIGVVVAVDGRNIISGRRSELQPRESMYVLDPYETQDYAGWRTNLREVHEFFFTDWRDSYAEAFNDRSARGVIAVAVFRDRDWQAQLREREPAAELSRGEGQVAGSADSAARAAAAPGTGFGERRNDPARRVQFSADATPVMQSFLKYEWPETLCQRGLGCESGELTGSNRFWPDDNRGFAPYPRRR